MILSQHWKNHPQTRPYTGSISFGMCTSPPGTDLLRHAAVFHRQPHRYNIIMLTAKMLNLRRFPLQPRKDSERET